MSAAEQDRKLNAPVARSSDRKNSTLRRLIGFYRRGRALFVPWKTLELKPDRRFPAATSRRRSKRVGDHGR